MEKKREVKFKLVAIKPHSDIEWEIFESPDYKMVEDFAFKYVGDHKEVFIKKVFVLLPWVRHE